METLIPEKTLFTNEITKMCEELENFSFVPKEIQLERIIGACSLGYSMQFITTNECINLIKKARNIYENQREI